MTFTNDDLARVKMSLDTLYTPILNPKIIAALIARLEAAENFISALITGGGLKSAPYFERM